MTQPDVFIHETALCECEAIGSGTRIWAFCNVQKGAAIGKDVNICDHCFIEQNAVIGDRVTIKNGVSVWDGVVIENDVFVGPYAVFTNDIYPRSKVRKDKFDKTLVRKGATIGANATILAGHSVGEHALIGAGAVLTTDAPDFTLWLGNPARLSGYVCRCARRLPIPGEIVEGGTQSEPYTAVCECGLEYELRDGQLTPRSQRSDS